MCEKLIKCAAENRFQNSKLYSTYTFKFVKKLRVHVLPSSKIYQLPEYYMMFARKYVFSRIWGGGQLPPPLYPVSCAYVPSKIVVTYFSILNHPFVIPQSVLYLQTGALAGGT